MQLGVKNPSKEKIAALDWLAYLSPTQQAQYYAIPKSQKKQQERFIQEVRSAVAQLPKAGR